MRTKVIMTICLFLLMVGKASAQWSVIDPTNIAQSIINSSNNIVHTSSTAQNMLNNFKETVKIYEQGKEDYDALKSVNNLVKGALKVHQTIFMVGDITDLYINIYQKMMHADNFSVEKLSAIVHDSIINNSDCKILLDQRKFMNKFDQIQSLLGLTEKEKSQILSINQSNDPSRLYKEVWIGLGGTQSAVYATEVSTQEYLAYTTEESEKLEVRALAEKLGGYMESAIRQLAEDKQENK